MIYTCHLGPTTTHHMRMHHIHMDRSIYCCWWGFVARAFWMLGRRSLPLFQMECQGLASLWEGDPEIRNRLLKDIKFLEFPKNKTICEPTRSNCVENCCILKPILTKLSVVPGYKLPHLDPLQVELQLLAEKLGVTKLGEKAVYQAAVSIKKLAGLVKRRVRRKEVTKDIIGPNNVYSFGVDRFEFSFDWWFQSKNQYIECNACAYSSIKYHAIYINVMVYMHVHVFRDYLLCVVNRSFLIILGCEPTQLVNLV